MRKRINKLKRVTKKISSAGRPQKRQPGVEMIMRPKPIVNPTHVHASNKLENKIAIVTGGDSGIGHAIALAFAREGADVVIVYLNEHKDAKKVKAEIEAIGSRCLLIAGDLGDEKFCKHVIEKTIKNFGKNAPMKRPGQPQEIAPCYVFLASDDSSFMSGQILHPNGGIIVNG